VEKWLGFNLLRFSMPTTKTNTFLASYTLCKRELVRFYRQPTRIIGVIGSPLVFWFLIGSGLGSSFKHPNATSEMNYLEYFFPGTIVLIVLFTAIFSTMSIIEDKQGGFLQSVLVAPVTRSSIALGKILGGTILSLIQSIILLALTPLIGISLSFLTFILIFLILFILSFGLTGLGFIIAWRMDSTQGFHAIMNLFLIPLWLLSGALFPPSGAAGWLSTVMMVNPLTYGVEGLRETLYLNSALPFHAVTTIPVSIAVIAIFAIVTFIFSSISVSKTR
jgi:ABC-2 type transport system permease protein